MISFRIICALAVAYVCTAPFISLASAAPKPRGGAVVQLRLADTNRYLMSAEVEGRRVKFIIDSGAGISGIDQRLARSLDLPSPPSRSGVPSHVVVNGRKVRMAMVSGLRAGPMNFGSAPMCVFPPGLLGDGDGLLGSDLLRRYKAVLDCGSAQLTFKTSVDSTSGLPAKLRSAGYRSVKLTDRGGNLFVPCRLQGEDFSLLVDTGAFVTLLQREKLTRLGIPSRKTGMRHSIVFGESSGIRSVHPEDHQLTVAGIPVNMVVGASSHSMFDKKMGSRGLGMLGTDVLQRHGAIIDFDSMLLYFRPPSGTAQRRR
ncbi:MAG TPA: pepsin/retropepsin-like aspartic protease family protein [Chthoniobacterales bacterium]|jgi:predicted aspartyl protease